ncbi:two-component system, NtrC family, sensor histidine kinase AtoS [Desulfofundulus australicus DSM 11792]|uniref:histidine kinase n=1 Tax=Desulfofundulus australicus DSM 11792 TaxID=1121425 RepID=A0A1M4TKC9_9FIRM|nr:two-component system sensor histidine kinase AtoS [Desulfofundulus australicus]SHE44737.1 two-component system, NtrC family, sensor histidine kinase AtoS [Desulfofundulus australicus DSM 11792]
MHKFFYGNRILFLVTLLLILPVLLTLYMMHIIKNSELSILEHQKAKLNQAAYLLDQNLAGSLDNYLAEQGLAGRTREEKIVAIGNYVNEKINHVKREYPEVHIGLYYEPLHVFYDGTARFDENFSLRRKKAFEETMSQRKSLVQNLGPEEGGVIEIYRPFTRNGKVEGVIRSAEYLSEVGYYGKRRHIEMIAYSAIAAVVLTGFGGAIYIFRDLVMQVRFIRQGLKTLEEDLSRTMPEAHGELGEIVEGINGFARRIAELNLYTETMLAVIDEAIVVVNAGGEVVLANNLARELFALPEGFKGRMMGELFSGNSPLLSYLERTLKEEKAFRDLMLNWSNGDKSPRQLLLSILPLKTASGELLGAVINCRDLTERMQLEEKVRRQERLAALGKLVTGVAHEIRNPLTSISCYIQHWMQNKQPSTQALATIQREITRLDYIVEQLLYFAKPAEARLFQRDLNVLIRELTEFFQEMYQGKYNLLLDLEADLPPVWMDAEQMERAVVNIIFNAIQAMPEGGTISISTAYLPGRQRVALTIADTGCGIPKENLAHLFTPFYSTRPKGTGLGLAIAYEIVQAHGGQIEVESEVGRGTKFTIYLRT